MNSDVSNGAATKLRAVQRHDLIIDKLSKAGFVTVPDMAEACKVSEMTMRRDLDHLAELGRIERTHGGAVSFNRNAEVVDLVEPDIGRRTTVNSAGKDAIAQHAASLVRPGQTIALDIGTTAQKLAQQLCSQPVNIYTASLRIAMSLSGLAPNVFVPGGRMLGTEPSIVGPQAVRNFSELCFDVVFIGVSGVSATGFYDYSLEDTHVKRALIEGSQKIVVLLDSTKFDRMSVARVCTLNEVDLLITDAEPPKDLRDLLGASGVEIQVAK